MQETITHRPPAETAVSVQQYHLDRILEALPGVTDRLTDGSLEEGSLGACLFYCYYARYSGDDRYFEVAEPYLDQALAGLDPAAYRKVYRTDSFDAKLAGAGRFIEFAVRHGFLEFDADAFLKPVDHVLLTLMRSRLAQGDLDLFTGALASGHYFYYRSASDPARRRVLEELADAIAQLARQDGEGDYYWLSPSLWNSVYFGVSHGSAMIMSFLAALCEAGIRPDECRTMLRKAANFVLKHQRRQPNGLFPVVLDDAVEGKQFSLCYGDLGVGYGLYRAASVLGDDDLWERTGYVLRDCAGRRAGDAFTGDAGIIYGASGVAAVFDKLHRLGGQEAFGAAARYWYEQIPRYATHANAYAGFRSMIPKAPEAYHVSYGLGMAGIGVSLMKYLKPDLPPLDGLTMLI